MGSHLSAPCKVIEEDAGAGNGMQYVAAGMQGWRRNMEDAHISKPDISADLSEAGVDPAAVVGKDEPVGLFAVFDGHGGKEVALFCEHFFVPELIKTRAFQEGNFGAALTETFHRMDEMLELPESEECLKTYRRIPNPSDALRANGANGSSGSGSGSGRGGGRGRGGMSAGDLAGEDAMVMGGEDEEEEGGAGLRPGEGKKLDYHDAIALFKALLEQQRGAGNIGGPMITDEDDDDEADGEFVEYVKDQEEEEEEEEEEDKLMDMLGGGEEEEEEEGDDDGQPRVWEESEIEGSASTAVETTTVDIVERISDDGVLESTSVSSSTEIVMVDAKEEEEEEEEEEKNEDLIAVRSSKPFKVCEGDVLIDYRKESAPASHAEMQAIANRMCRLQEHKLCAGCTAVVALRVGNKVYVANAGDSRAVLSRNGAAVALSLDHKPFQQREFSRIQKAGGFVTPVGRVNGNLNLSRAIGDLKYKKVQSVARHEQIISAEPDISVITLLPEEDEFLLLACDGVWDRFTNQDAVDFVRERLQAGMALSDIVAAAFEFCICQDPKLTGGAGSDNMTLIIVTLKETSAFHRDGERK